MKGMGFLWPQGPSALYRDRVQDGEIVEAIAAGDVAGLAVAYDRYAPGLYAYCRSLLTDPADAADAVQDTFIITAAKVRGLRDPERFRPWLYAVARNECFRQLRALGLSAPLDLVPEVTAQEPGPAAGPEREELRALVAAALTGLNPGDREVIELNLRHTLDGADLADALGVSRTQAQALVSRARSQFEGSLGVLLVARDGREACAGLEDILAGWNGELTILLRKRVNRHIETCEVCSERKRQELSPAMLLSTLPMVARPAGGNRYSAWSSTAHRLASGTGTWWSAGRRRSATPGSPGRSSRRAGYTGRGRWWPRPARRSSPRRCSAPGPSSCWERCITRVGHR